MKDEVIIRKVNSMERSIQKVYTVYDDNPNELLDTIKQDSIVLNIHRACKAAIDLSIHIIAEYHLGVPQSFRDSFDILYEKGIINQSLKLKLKNMEEFRHIAVDDSKKINLNFLKRTVENDLKDLSLLGKEILKY
ncbi:type VII toxin-antitoxin system HepT family RNase toxin [Halobacillus sp. B23F22_1]|uniref:type VII toxin-antitoxin system HepT family RNase toxin n=1 Tax=Halobacillus sp. B23F22_1 TaxID=3459514 RepID=UPI00373EB5F5